MDSLMPGFDKEIAKLAQRVLINPRKIDYHTGVLATKVTPGAAPCEIAPYVDYVLDPHRDQCALV